MAVTPSRLPLAYIVGSTPREGRWTVRPHLSAAPPCGPRTPMGSRPDGMARLLEGDGLPPDRCAARLPAALIVTDPELAGFATRLISRAAPMSPRPLVQRAGASGAGRLRPSAGGAYERPKGDLLLSQTLGSTGLVPHDARPAATAVSSASSSGQSQNGCGRREGGIECQKTEHSCLLIVERLGGGEVHAVISEAN